MKGHGLRIFYPPNLDFQKILTISTENVLICVIGHLIKTLTGKVTNLKIHLSLQIKTFFSSLIFRLVWWRILLLIKMMSNLSWWSFNVLKPLSKVFFILTMLTLTRFSYWHKPAFQENFRFQVHVDRSIVIFALAVLLLT